MLEKEIEDLTREFKRAFEKLGAEHAFGDPQLVKLVREVNERVQILETTDPCAACDGKGYVEHDCYCPYCTTTEVDCEKCFGDGRIPK